MPVHRPSIVIETQGTACKRRLAFRISTALALCILSCSCARPGFWDGAPVRNVGYNPYVSSRLVRSNPRGDSGVVYRPATHSRTVIHEEYKEVVEYTR